MKGRGPCLWFGLFTCSLKYFLIKEEEQTAALKAFVYTEEDYFSLRNLSGSLAGTTLQESILATRFIIQRQ